jgi:small subunit ribosomal protein S20
LPTTKTAEKEMRVAKRRQIRNKSIRTVNKSRITKAEGLISGSEKDAAKTAVTSAISALDKSIGKGIIHRNNAARRKSRLMKKLNSAKASPASEAPRKG